VNDAAILLSVKEGSYMRETVRPMTLSNMRQNGVRMIWAKCEACGHQADVNVDALEGIVAVPKVGERLCGSGCGGKQINTQPAWHTR
jgi:hypothetical protein